MILVALLSGIISCSDSPEPATIEQPVDTVAVSYNRVKLSPQQAETAAIESGFVQHKELYKTLRVSGKVDVPPQHVISMSVPLSGFLRNMNLLPGSQVKKGEVLARLEDQQYIQLQQDYLVAKSKLAYLEGDFSRQKALNVTKASSDKVLQQVKHEFESQNILVRSLEEKLKLIGLSPSKLHDGNISRYINIYSPINGFVTKVNANIGKYVSSTDVLVELVSLKDIHLSLEVLENDAALLHRGQKVMFYSNADTMRKFQASVHLINPTIDDERTTEVHCDISSYDKTLFPGMYVNAEIQLDNADAKVLPEQAIVRWNDETYVFCDEGQNSYRMLKVETGSTASGFTEIKSAIPANKIVFKNAYTLLMALKNSSAEGS